MGLKLYFTGSGAAPLQIRDRRPSRLIIFMKCTQVTVKLINMFDLLIKMGGEARKRRAIMERDPRQKGGKWQINGRDFSAPGRLDPCPDNSNASVAITVSNFSSGINDDLCVCTHLSDAKGRLSVGDGIRG